jgi:transcriptional regulator with XRE-family HTH domain
MDLVVTERRAAFCARLKAAREKKGVSLEQIAASTKISRSLFTGLEGTDLSRWPKGLYRRSYLRDYLKAVDLPPESVVAEFVRLFPEEGAVPEAACDDPEDASPAPLSMTLAEGRAERMAKARRRIGAATIDAGIVTVVCGLASWVLQADIRTSGALVALGYYSISTAALGCSVGSRWLEHRSGMRWRRPASHAAPPMTLLARLRRMKALERPDPAMTEDLPGVPWNAALLRTLSGREP